MKKWLINASYATDWTPKLKLEQSSSENQKMLKENRMKKKLLREQALRGLTMSVHFTNPIFFLEIKNAQHIFLFQWTIETHRYNEYNYSRYISSGYVWFRDLFWMQETYSSVSIEFKNNIWAFGHSLTYFVLTLFFNSQKKNFLRTEWQTDKPNYKAPTWSLITILTTAPFP